MKARKEINQLKQNKIKDVEREIEVADKAIKD